MNKFTEKQITAAVMIMLFIAINVLFVAGILTINNSKAGFFELAFDNTEGQINLTDEGDFDSLTATVNSFREESENCQLEFFVNDQLTASDQLEIEKSEKKEIKAPTEIIDLIKNSADSEMRYRVSIKCGDKNEKIYKDIIIK